MRRLSLGNVVTWIPVEDHAIRHFEDYIWGNYPS